MSSLLLSIDILQIYYFIMFYFKFTNGSMYKCWMVIWCIGEINNRTSHFLSHKYSIFLCVLFSNTTLSLTIKNKQTLIRYRSASLFIVFFLICKTGNCVNILSIIATFSPSPSYCRCCCWHFAVVVGVSASAPCCWSRRRRCLSVVTVFSLSSEVSILVAVSVGFCALSLAAPFRCHLWRRHLNQN